MQMLCPLLRFLLATLTMAVLAGCQTVPGTVASGTLPPPVLQALQKANVPADALAAIAIPLFAPAAPATAWSWQADKSMQPGSTMKLLTSIVALDRLGPNHRGSTQLRSAAPEVSGVLQGDLALVGGADPDLDVPQFWGLLRELRHRGITTIQGDLLVDRTLFRPARMDIGVPPFDDDPQAPYNVIPDALQLAGNLLTLDLQATDDGVVATSLWPLAGLLVGSSMAMVDEPCSRWSDLWRPATSEATANGSTLVLLQGAFPRGCSVRVQRQVIDRLELAQRLFRTLWQNMGGRWTGQAREAAAPAGSRLLAQHTSRTWGEVLRPMNKQSDNPLTRLLYLQLGVAAMEQQPQATTAELAAEAVRGWLQQHAIDAGGLVLDNGSGLSRSERITPRQLATVLAVAHAGPNAADLQMSMPTVGVDGTMRNRLQASPAAGWARLKSGTLRNVVAVAGYVRDAAGRPWAVAAMINHDDVSTARPVLDVWIDGIARGQQGPFGPWRALP